MPGSIGIGINLPFLSGSVLRALAEEDVDHFDNYANLRASGSAELAIVTGQGLFYRNVGGAVDNGIQVGNYRRVFQGGIRPEWWVDLDSDGNAIVQDGQNIRSAIAAAVAEGTKLVESDLGLLWTIENELNFSVNDFTFRNLNIKRANAVSTTLSSAYSSGTSISVSDASSFRVGDVIALLYVGGASAGKGDSDTGGSRNVITNISGTTITVNQAFTLSANNPADYPIGSTVLRVFDMFKTSGTGYLAWENCKIDGNKANNDHTYSWHYNAVYNGPETRIIIKDSEFQNFPCEGFIGCTSAILDNLKIKDLNGSFYHISNTSIDTSEVFCASNWQVENTNIQRVLNGHGRGMIEFSAKVHNVHLVNVFGINDAAYGSILGSISGTDGGKVSMIGCRFENYTEIGGASFSSTNVRISYFDYEGCDFINCGDTTFAGEDVREGNACERIRFRNCQLINCRLAFANVAMIELINTRFDWDGTVTYSSAYVTDSCAIRFSNWDRLTIHNVNIVGPAAFDQYITEGLLMRCIAATVRKDSGGTDLKVLYSQQVHINGLYMRNWRAAVCCHQSTYNNVWTVPVAGWYWNNIVVEMPDSTHTGSGVTAWAIHVPPGCVAKNLTVVSKYNGNASGYPIVAAGIDSTADSTVLAGNRGAFIDGWTVLGPVSRVMLIGGSTAGRSNYNVRVKNGTLFGTGSSTMTNYDTGRSLVDTPEEISSSTTGFAGFTAPLNDILHDLYENSGQY